MHINISFIIFCVSYIYIQIQYIKIYVIFDLQLNKSAAERIANKSTIKQTATTTSIKKKYNNGTKQLLL